MAKVKKANRVLTVDEASVQIYLKDGYDQIDEKGEVIKRATAGRTVSLAEHNKVLEELGTLKKSPADTDELNKEIEKLEEEVEELKKQNKVLKTENTKLKNAAEPPKGE